MKKLFSIFFIFVFVIHNTNDLWILSNFYLQQDYISQNICINRFDKIPVCNGQCYLQEQLQNSENNENEYPNLKEKKLHFINRLFSVVIDTPFILISSLQYNCIPNNLYSYRLISRVFHPPQMV